MSLRPWYNQDANFQTNAKSFMDYLARTNKFLEVLIEDYDNFQELVIEELERIKFDSEIAVDDILVNWLEDGTLARIINDGVLGNKADQSELDKTNDILDETNDVLGNKADQSELDETNDVLGNKADQSELDDTNVHLEHTTNNVNSIRINALFPPAPLVKLKTYEEGETSQELKNLISYCSENKVELFIPSGNFLINETINLPRGFTLTGSGSEVWGNEGGTKIITTDTSQSAVFKAIDTSVKLSDLKVENGGGLSGKIGIEFDNRSYNFEMVNVIARGFDIGFKIADAWTYKISKCRTEAGRIGFQFSQGTSAEITACVAFNASEIGFDISGMTYSVFTGSGSDGCSIGLKIGNSTRGVTFVSFGVENASQHGWLLDGSNIAATFTAPNFGNHSAIESNLIKIIGDSIGGSDLTITDLRLTTAFSPTNHNFIAIDDMSRLTLINPAIFGKIENLWEKNNVTIIGGRYSLAGGISRNKINGLLGLHEVSVNKINTLEGRTNLLASDATYKVATLQNNSTYLFTAHTSEGTQNNLSIVRVNEDGVIRIHPISNEFIDFIRGEETNELSIENKSDFQQYYLYSGIRLR